jgi:hypothetical protein
MRLVIAATIALFAFSAAAAERLPIEQRTIFSGEFPRAVFFRTMEVAFRWLGRI